MPLPDGVLESNFGALVEFAGRLPDEVQATWHLYVD
jgi:hypothetical protein